MMVERNVTVDHVAIWRWVQRYAPELRRRCLLGLRPTSPSWRVDETYLRVAGKWTYLYRAVDSTGATIDFLLAAKLDAAAAKRFFQKALRSVGHPLSGSSTWMGIRPIRRSLENSSALENSDDVAGAAWCAT